MTIPGVGPIASTAITALVPAAEGFTAGRHFAAWLGLTPFQKSTGGKQKLGAVSKRGERTIRRLARSTVEALVVPAPSRRVLRHTLPACPYVFAIVVSLRRRDRSSVGAAFDQQG